MNACTATSATAAPSAGYTTHIHSAYDYTVVRMFEWKSIIHKHNIIIKWKWKWNFFHIFSWISICRLAYRGMRGVCKFFMNIFHVSIIGESSFNFSFFNYAVLEAIEGDNMFPSRTQLKVILTTAFSLGLFASFDAICGICSIRLHTSCSQCTYQPNHSM